MTLGDVLSTIPAELLVSVLSTTTPSSAPIELNVASVVPPTGSTVMAMLADPIRLPVSVTEAAIVWLPTVSALVENDAPDPMAPSRFDVHERLAERFPSCVSLAVPVKPIAVPTM